MPELACLQSATFYVRERDGELWNCFRLQVTTPHGDQAWDTGWGCYGSAAPWQGKGLESFQVQMRSSFDDLMSELAEAGLMPDRGFDDLLVDVDLPATLRTFVESQPP